MLKRILIILAVVVLALVLIEVVNLYRLKTSIGRYASYWKGQTTKNGEFTYVALGDSAAQGVGASSPQNGYVGLLGKQIANTTGKSVRIVNLSVSGAEVEDVIDKQLPQLKNYKPDLITVEIGSNNVTHWNESAFAAQYNTLAAALPRGTVVANIPYFGGRSHQNDEAVAASKIIAAAAARYHLKLVDLQSYTAQYQSWLNYSWDFFHPSNRGYRIWDAAFWPIVKSALPQHSTK